MRAGPGCPVILESFNRMSRHFHLPSCAGVSVLSLLLFGAATAVAQPAPAPHPGDPPLLDPSGDKADELHRQALDAAKAGKHDRARELLLEAFALKKSHDIAANLGNSEMELHRYRDAAEHLAWSLRHAPTGQSDRREALEKMLKEARTHVGSVALRSSVEGAELSVDGVTAGRSPLEGEVFVEPGAHKFAAVLTGYEPANAERVVDAGKEESVELVMVAVGPAPSGWIGYAPGAALLATGAVALGIGAGLRAAAGAAADSADATLSELLGTGVEAPCLRAANAGACAQVHDDRGAHDRMANAGVSLLVVGGAALVTGAVLFAVAGTSKPPAAAVIPFASVGSAGLAAFGSF